MNTHARIEVTTTQAISSGWKEEINETVIWTTKRVSKLYVVFEKVLNRGHVVSVPQSNETKRLQENVQLANDTGSVVSCQAINQVQVGR